MDREEILRQREILLVLARRKTMPLREIRSSLTKPPSDRRIREELLHLKRLGLVTQRGFGRGSIWMLEKGQEGWGSDWCVASVRRKDLSRDGAIWQGQAPDCRAKGRFPIKASGHTMAEKRKEVRFVADSMVGKLAKWLRVLGYDTYYQPCYPPDVIDMLLREGRILLTRHRKRAERLGNLAVLVRGNHVSEQLTGLTRELHIEPARSAWFSRCLVCNTLLMDAREGDVRERIPEYVFYQNVTRIRVCPSCGRHFWPGSHSVRMETQLKKWGFPLQP
ncbi:MAG: Mut7-C RNAse domain-containing protein [Pseudomonadota bacterium]